MGISMVVCMKQVPDPEGPAASFEADTAGNRVVTHGLPPVANPYDENALEVALGIKAACDGNITLLSLGKSLSRPVLLKAMATGVDDAIVIEGDSLDPQDLDSHATATLLSAALRRVDFDLILVGRQAADTNAGQVGLGMAQILGIPALSLARKVEVNGGVVLVESVLPDGFVRMSAPLPALVTVSHEAGELRYPSLAAIKAAKSIPKVSYTPGDLGVELPIGAMVTRIAVAMPSRERRCQVMSGENPEETGEMLAERLYSDKVI